MPIKRINAKSPDASLSKYEGDNTLARIAHVNQVVDELNSTNLVGAAGPQGVQGPTGPQGVPGPVGPAGLTWRSSWVAGTSYSLNDAVGFGGASYFCILATSGTTTPNLATTNWALLASQGAIGATGATGAQGPTGPQGPVGTGIYKVYTALATWGAGGLTTTVLENTLGATITWADVLTTMTGTASSAVFTSGKTVFITGSYFALTTSYNNVCRRVNTTTLNLFSIETATGAQGAAFGQSFILEIRVYP
jgi:hypothetical protein